MKALPRNASEIQGRRAARWYRESTAGQFDAFGPDAQRDQQDRAIALHGLIDSGLEWSVAASGWKTAWQTPAWQAMLEAARSGTFDILVVGHASRFLRNLKQTLDVVEDHLRPAGVAVLFADERILSSDPDQWDQFVREAHEAESFSRKLSKRVGEGYASKRRRLGVPGGNRPPFGYLRIRTDAANPRSPQQLDVDPENAPLVRRAFELSASGLTDREVAAALDLKVTHLREILKNPVYVGRLRTGEPSGGPALIPIELWDQSVVVRARYARRNRGPAHSGRTRSQRSLFAPHVVVV